jgi:hypothetical protein
MKQIGAEIGVNESRVSQLHARAIQRLKKALGADCADALTASVLPFRDAMRRLRMAKAEMPAEQAAEGAPTRPADTRVLPYQAPTRAARPVRRRSAERHHAMAAAR